MRVRGARQVDLDSLIAVATGMTIRSYRPLRPPKTPFAPPRTTSKPWEACCGARSTPTVDRCWAIVGPGGPGRWVDRRWQSIEWPFVWASLPSWSSFETLQRGLSLPPVGRLYSRKLGLAQVVPCEARTPNAVSLVGLVGGHTGVPRRSTTLETLAVSASAAHPVQFVRSGDPPTL